MIRYIWLILSLVPLWADCQDNLTLWYKDAAREWTQALPLGNGRLGAMVFGGVNEDLIQLNESTLWSGGPVKTNVNPQAYNFLLQTREALFNGENYTKAAALAKKMQGVYSQSYLPLADLRIIQDFRGAVPSSYYRDLDIGNAITTTRFTINGTEYTRQVIISHADQVMAIHLTANKPKQISVKVGIRSILRYQNAVRGDAEIVLKGKAPAHVDPNYVRYNQQPVIYSDSLQCRGMRFNLSVRPSSSDGIIVSDTSGVTINDASDVTILLSAATSYNGYDKCPDKDGQDEDRLATGYLNEASKKNWQTILANHKADYHKYFNRVSFSLATPADNNNALLPTDERLLGYTRGARDPGLEALYFQYSRYLLISSSRPGGVPANLQGIWNKELRAPWSSNYTININTQMNYWPAEMANLSEMHLPLMDFIAKLSVTGQVTAKEFYHANGWAAHHNSDIWALSNPVGDLGRGDPKWANWALASPWLSQHLFEHYEFTGDKKFLREVAYPLMKGAALFCIDWLVKDKTGKLVTAPAVSPENDFIDDKGQKGSVSIATTMDMSIIRDLFANVIDASIALNEDQSFRELIIDKKNNLYPLHIGKKGNLQEWYKDWEDVDPHHRHVSHLFGLHPGREISPVKTPEYAAAAKRSLELRGDEGTGWSLAWKINFWARLLDGNHAYTMIRNLLRITGQAGTEYSKGGGSYINLFDAHPPFQIDGNFGGLAGMIEMLLQSHLNRIDLLPALPDEWSKGRVTGLKARGNFEVGITWAKKAVTRATITSVTGGLCKIKTPNEVKIKGVSAKAIKTMFGYEMSFQTQKGKTYEMTSL